MAIITFMSDFGYRDPYVAAVKAKIFSIHPNLQIIDITHEIEHFNIPHAAYVLRSVFRDFPKGTVHLVSVNVPIGGDEKLVALKLEDHYFVGVDNGLFSLLSDKQAMIVELNKSKDYSPIFPEKGILVNAAVALASGTPIYNLGKHIHQLNVMLNRQLRVTKEMISGNVMHVDNYGNIITNIPKVVFEKQCQGRPFLIKFSRETIELISDSYNSMEGGDCIALFNTGGYLEIAIRQGHAANLLGMRYDSPVMVKFLDA